MTEEAAVHGQCRLQACVGVCVCFVCVCFVCVTGVWHMDKPTGDVHVMSTCVIVTCVHVLVQ